MTAGRKRILIATHELPWVASLRKRPATTTSPPLTSSTAVTNNASSNPVHNADVNCYRNSVSVESSESPGVQESEETETLADFEWNFADRRRHSALFSAIRALARNGLGLQAFEEEEEEVLHVGLAGTLFDRNQQPISLSPLVKSSPAFTSASDGGYSFLEKMNSQHAAYSAPNLAEEVGTADSPAAVPARELDALRSSLREQLMAEKSCVPVFVDKHVSFGHYEGFCKSNIWPLFHYIMWDQATDGVAESRYWLDYIAVNEEFAETIVKEYREGDLIWIQDYHLMLVPQLVRKLLPDASIGFFLHTPFPSSEIFRCLPKRKEILLGILHSNLIGFQTYSYARHFISSCTRLLGLESTPKGVDFKGFMVAVEIFPIGIDVQRVELRRNLPTVKGKAAAIREIYADKKIIFGRDKLDHIKGVQHKLNAFELFLQLYPEWYNKAVLILVTAPPPRESPKVEMILSKMVSRINGIYGSLEFSPVHHYHHHLDQDDYFALLSVADIGLITSVRDGMNTTSHEFVVCQQNNFSPLILSELSGTASSLSSATLVNPWDYKGSAIAINEALLMSNEDKSLKHAQLYDHVIKNTAEYWATTFLKELQLTVEAGEQMIPTPRLEMQHVIKTYQSSSKRLLLFDYDGTLTPIRKTPNAAVPPPEMLKAMEVLVSDPKNYVFVISGRDQACLDNWLGHIKGLGLSAEHGSFIKYPDLHGQQWRSLLNEMDLSWKNEVAEIFNYYSERTQGSFVEYKQSSITWHYRLADPEYGTFQAQQCHHHLEEAIVPRFPVEVLLGKKNLEVRPIVINKGEIVRRLLASRNQDWDWVICAGDDKTDEDMFKALRYGHTHSSAFNSPERRRSINSHTSSNDNLSVTSSPTSSRRARQRGNRNRRRRRQQSSSSDSDGGGIRSGAESVNSSRYEFEDEDNDSDSLIAGGGGGKKSMELLTCTVGPSSKKTHAEWHVESPEDLIVILGQMALCSE